MPLIKSAAGIRGTIGGLAGDNLTPLDLVQLVSAYAFWLRKNNDNPRVVVGRDGRISGLMIKKLVMGTLMSCGVDVIDIDQATTPTVESEVVRAQASGGIIITASHNPKQWNALKLLNNLGEFVSVEDNEEIFKLAEEANFSYSEVDHLGQLHVVDDALEAHLEQILALEAVQVDLIKSRKLKIAVDGINSVGGVAVPALLKKLGVEVFELNCEVTGDFAHVPEPLEENLGDMKFFTREKEADLGIVVDPDVDRLSFICQDGTMFGEEYTLVAIADYILSQSESKITVSNLSSSRALGDIARKLGGEYHASPVGEVPVIAKMKEVGAVIGGEGNGGIVYPPLHYNRDALVGIALFLSYFCSLNKSMTELRDSYPRYYMTKDKLALEEGLDIAKILDGVKEIYGQERLDEQDGLKIDFADGWIHLRQSKTEPIIRIYAEHKNQNDLATMVNKVKEEINKLK